MLNLNFESETNFLKNEIAILNNREIVYKSVQLKFDWKIDLETKLKRIGKFFINNAPPFKYQDILLTKSYNRDFNSTVIPMGERYGGLIGIDIDNKNDTIAFFNELAKKNNCNLNNTFTVETINKGTHRYYEATKIQQLALKDFKSADGKIFVRPTDVKQKSSIDVKYNNQILFGPTYDVFDKQIVTYKVIHDKKIAELPDFIFQEILRVHAGATNKKTIKVVVKEEVVKEEVVKKVNVKEVNIKEEIIKKPIQDLATEKVIKDLINILQIPIPVKRNLQLSKEEVQKIEHRFDLYLPCLLEFRCDTRSEWLSIGAAMYNEYCTYDFFEKFSKQSTSFNKKDCITMWNSFSDKRTVKSNLTGVIEKAKIDTKEKSRHLLWDMATMSDDVLILESLFTRGYTDQDMACLFFSTEETNFVYVSEQDCWYACDEHGIFVKDIKSGLMYDCFRNTISRTLTIEYTRRLSILNNSLALKQDDLENLQLKHKKEEDAYKEKLDEKHAKILNKKTKEIHNNKNMILDPDHEVVNKAKIAKAIKQEREDEEDEKDIRRKIRNKQNIELEQEIADHAQISIKIKNLYNKFDSLIIACRNTQKIEQITKLLVKIYASLELRASKNSKKHSNVYSKFNRVNVHLVGFDNGVYDLDKDIFRKAEKDEYISVNTKYSYKKCDLNKRKKLEKILEDIFPDKEELKYFLKTQSLGLVGENPGQKFYILIGNGANGKGIIQSLMDSTLGEYFNTTAADQLYLSKDAKATAANSGLAKLMFTRYYSVTELSTSHLIDSAFLKKITGGDTISPRDLYCKEARAWTVQFTLFMQANAKPDFSNFDGGMQRRTILITFPNKFVEKPKLKHERLLDKDLDTLIKADEYQLEMMDILIEHYKLYKKEGMELPPRIKADTERLIAENIPFKSWFESNIEQTNNKKDAIKTTVLLNLFKEYLPSDEQKKALTHAKFTAFLDAEKIEFKHKRDGNYYIGIKLIDDEEEDDE
jgi:P4 family phage/plasmid primase-like protien